MKTLRLVLGDQLSRSLSALRDIDRARDVVLMVEVHEESTYVRHHKQKIALVLSAMRHFAETLRAEGIDVDYVRTPVEIREDDRFLCSRAEFAAFAQGRKSLRMEFFYRHMRRKTGWLMKGGRPEGGKWNYDVLNRRALPKGVKLHARRRFRPDTVTRDVMTLVENRFADHFGELAHFGWAVTRKGALSALHADGGVLGSKPYAASGAYIDRMSDYCRGCAFDPNVKLGPKACPFNYLYWHFLIVNEPRLRSNPRMAMPYRTLARMAAGQRQRIVREAQQFLEGMGSRYRA